MTHDQNPTGDIVRWLGLRRIRLTRLGRWSQATCADWISVRDRRRHLTGLDRGGFGASLVGPLRA